jgi:hypothetical protein
VVSRVIDIGVMCSCEKILETARKENVDIIGNLFCYRINLIDVLRAFGTYYPIFG